MTGKIKFYYNPQSRAAVTRWMLEEVGADYEIVPIDFKAGDTRTPAFLAINPMGKIPTLVLPDGTVLTENGAIIAWLAAAYPDAGLSPPPGSSEHGLMLRWLFFCGSAFEPALTECMLGSEADGRSQAPWWNYDDVVDTLEKLLVPGRYILGERFCAADVYLAASLGWGTVFGAPRLKDSEIIQSYVARATDRPAYKRANAA